MRRQRAEGATRDEASRAHELSQLQCLRELRERKARAAREACRAKCEAAERAVRERERAIQRLAEELRELGAFVCQEGATALPRIAPYASARRAMLDERLLQERKSLEEEREALAGARAELEQADIALLKACRHRQAMDKLAGDTSRLHARTAGQRLERDRDDARIAAEVGL